MCDERISIRCVSTLLGLLVVFYFNAGATLIVYVPRLQCFQRNVSLISKCECGALAGHLEGMDGSLIDRGHGYFVAPEEDPVRLRICTWEFACLNRSVNESNPFSLQHACFVTVLYRVADLLLSFGLQ